MAGVVSLLGRMNLLEQIPHTLLGDALLDATIPQRILLAGMVHFSLVSFHSVSFATTGLTIGKDGCMIALDDFTDIVCDPEAFVDVILIMVGIEDLVEIVELRPVAP